MSGITDHLGIENDLAGLNRSSSSSGELRDGSRSRGSGGSGGSGSGGSRSGTADHGGTSVNGIDREQVFSSEQGRSDTDL